MSWNCETPCTYKVYINTRETEEEEKIMSLTIEAHGANDCKRMEQGRPST